jgi:hypothetical protein
MIFEFFLSAIIFVVEAILTLIPNVPAVPSAISSAGTWVTTQIANSMSFLTMIYGGVLLTAIILVIIAMFSFEFLYFILLWVVRKLPIGID